MITSYTLEEIAEHLDAELRGNATDTIHGIAPLARAKAGEISFLQSVRYKSCLSTTQATAVIINSEDAKDCGTSALVLANPYLGFAKVAALFDHKPQYTAGIHPAASVGKHCEIPDSVYIGPQCMVDDNVKIGENTIIEAGTHIGRCTEIGENCHLFANVTLYHGVILGDDIIIHSGAVIGSDGFGMVNENGKWHKIPQLGGVRIGNGVEIGANTVIDRGTLDDTVIEEGAKLDNLIQIAHNVRIGESTAIAGCTAIAGSTIIGKHCMIAGAACINGHIEITDNVILTACATVGSSISVPGVYSSGTNVQPNQKWRKNAVRFNQLDEMARRLRRLEKKEQQ